METFLLNVPLVGVDDDDDFIGSDDTDYVLRRIRELYLQDSTVTIVLVGKCTRVRKYIDWEVASSLGDDPVNKRSGLLAIELPSIAGSSNKLPERIDDNVKRDSSKNDYGYARWVAYPARKSTLESYIENAYDLRTSVDPDNTRPRFSNNRPC